jgi:hypothetical protein
MTPALTSRQITICMAYGAVVFLLAALLLRQIALAGWLDGSARAITFLLAVPGSVPVVLVLRRLAGLLPGQLLGGMAIGTGTATLLDGLALSWAPALYGGPDHAAAAGAAILWGAGVLIFLGYVLDRPARS